MSSTHPFRWIEYQTPLLDPGCKARHLLLSLPICFRPERCQGRICLLFITWSCCGQFSCDSRENSVAYYSKTGLCSSGFPAPLLQVWDLELEQWVNSIFHGQYLLLVHSRRRTILSHLAHRPLLTKFLSFHIYSLFLGLFITLSNFCISFCFHQLLLKHLLSQVYQWQCCSLLQGPVILRPLLATNKLQVLW